MSLTVVLGSFFTAVTMFLSSTADVFLDLPVGGRVVTISRYDDIPRYKQYDYHTVYICLSTVVGENKRRRNLTCAYGNNFPLKCSLAPPTHTAETTSETDIVMSTLISIPRRNIN